MDVLACIKRILGLQIRSKSNGEDRLVRRGDNAATPVIQSRQPGKSPDTEILHEVLFSHQFYDVRLGRPFSLSRL